MFRNKVFKQVIHDEAGNELTVFAQRINKRKFGEAWAFTVDEGVIGCIPHGERVFEIVLYANGKIYAINGTAKSRRVRGKPFYADLREIWADDPNIPGAKKNIGSFIDVGKSLIPKKRR